LPVAGLESGSSCVSSWLESRCAAGTWASGAAASALLRRLSRMKAPITMVMKSTLEAAISPIALGDRAAGASAGELEGFTLESVLLEPEASVDVGPEVPG